MNVLHRERADGVDLRLQGFLDWWAGHGAFPLLVLTDGGVRTNEALQAHFFEAGVSKAKTLAETPHGRAGALDLAPLIHGNVPWTDMGLFRTIGIAAEKQGFQWGGRWTNPVDCPHVQVPNWKLLPFPPVPVGASQ